MSAEIPSPALVFYPERIEENIRRMIAVAGDAGRLRPHVKTHKTGEIVKLQLKHGIRRFKCSTIAEAEWPRRPGPGRAAGDAARRAGDSAVLRAAARVSRRLLQRHRGFGGGHRRDRGRRGRRRGEGVPLDRHQLRHEPNGRRARSRGRASCIGSFIERNA